MIKKGQRFSIYQCKPCSKVLVIQSYSPLYRSTTLKEILRNENQVILLWFNIRNFGGTYLFILLITQLNIHHNISIYCLCGTVHTAQLNQTVFFFLCYLFLTNSLCLVVIFFPLAILIFILPVCLYRPQCVCLERTARPVRHGSTSALLARA